MTKYVTLTDERLNEISKDNTEYVMVVNANNNNGVKTALIYNEASTSIVYELDDYASKLLSSNKISIKYYCNIYDYELQNNTHGLIIKEYAKKYFNNNNNLETDTHTYYNMYHFVFINEKTVSLHNAKSTIVIDIKGKNKSFMHVKYSDLLAYPNDNITLCQLLKLPKYKKRLEDLNEKSNKKYAFLKPLYFVKTRYSTSLVFDSIMNENGLLSKKSDKLKYFEYIVENYDSFVQLDNYVYIHKDIFSEPEFNIHTEIDAYNDLRVFVNYKKINTYMYYNKFCNENFVKTLLEHVNESNLKTKDLNILDIQKFISYYEGEKNGNTKI